MRNINEFLSSKNINRKFLPKNTKIEDYLEMVFMEVYEENEKGAKDITDEFLAIANEYGMKNYRVFGNSENVDNILKKYACNVAQLFETMMEDKYAFHNFTEEVLEDVIDNYTNMSEIRTDEMGYDIYYSDCFIYVYGENDRGILFENLDEDITISPKIYSYSESRKMYVELSSRALISELKTKNDDAYEQVSEHFWNNYNEMVADYVKLAEEKFQNDLGLIESEIEIFGRQGKHVCIKPSFMLFHRYDEVIKTIDDLQDKLLKDAQDELDWLIEEYESNNA